MMRKTAEEVENHLRTERMSGRTYINKRVVHEFGYELIIILSLFCKDLFPFLFHRSGEHDEVNMANVIK